MSMGAEIVRDLARFLSQDSLTVDDVARHVGPVIHDPGEYMSAELDPVISGLATARLARLPNTDVPYLLELGFDQESRPTVGSLKAMFGDYRHVLTDRERPREIQFDVPDTGRGWHTVVIVNTPADSRVLEEAPVIKVALRRDAV
ncbi:MAG TPA: hypothetical protein VH438_10645 [Gemmatimonadales bacterium]|jgi:hypothetical protein